MVAVEPPSTAESPGASEGEWVPVARELVYYGIGPWLGPKYARWLNEQTRPHPLDPSALLIPKRLYEVYKNRPLFSKPTPEQLRAIGIIKP